MLQFNTSKIILPETPEIILPETLKIIIPKTLKIILPETPAIIIATGLTLQYNATHDGIASVMSP